MIKYKIHTTPNNTKFLLTNNTNDVISNEIVQIGSFENNIVNAAINALANINDPYILDIGANIGTFSIPIAQRYPNSRIECYEIQQQIFYQLCSNILLNGLTNINAHKCGITDHTSIEFIDMIDLTQSRNFGAYTLDKNIRKINPQGNYYTLNNQRSQMIKLDDITLHTTPSLIKIDVEGLEFQVLSGGINLLSKYKPIILIEIWTNSWFHNQRNKILNLLESLNYKLIEDYGDNLLFK